MEINKAIRNRENIAVKANVRQRKDLNWKQLKTSTLTSYLKLMGKILS